MLNYKDFYETKGLVPTQGHWELGMEDPQVLD